MDELKRFERDLKNQKELKKRFDELIKQFAEEGRAQNDGELTVMAAKELGYDISIAALEKARAEAEELDPKALDAVSGGGPFLPDETDRDGHDDWCLVAWHCFATILHTSSQDDSQVACWKDYECVWSYHRGLFTE